MTHAIPEGYQVQLRALPIALWCSEYTQGTFPERREEQRRFEGSFSPLVGAYVACIRIADGFRTLSVSAWTLRCGRTNDFGWVLKRERDALGDESGAPRSGWQRKASAPGGVEDPAAVPSDAGVDAYGDDVTDAADAGVPRPRELATFGPNDAAMLELDASDANAQALWVLPNERYRIFWCHDQALFLAFLHAFEAAPAEAVKRYALPVYAVEWSSPDSVDTVSMLRLVGTSSSI